ncbi:MAG: HAMP domain-containing sensor histidine kinase [Archangium sp.]|nr:HAMP domain-containing sensor histidine kinase [Archangium sp.]
MCEKLRMAVPPSVELLSFRRTFTRLILLVVLPSAGLLAFGIVGIVNERAAVEKRIEVLWTGRLATAQNELADAFADAQVRSTSPTLVLQRGSLQLTDVGFTVSAGEVVCEDPRITAALKPLDVELMSLPERPVIFSITSPQGTFLVAALRRGQKVIGAQVSAKAVQTLLQNIGDHLTPPGEEGTFMLVPVKRSSPAEGMVARLAEAREAALGDRELAGLLMPLPLQDFRLVVVTTGADPVAAASTRNRWIYSVLLGLFYITLALGVIFTGRTLYREARLSRLKTDFVSLVSHELRTPLTSIRMFIEMLALGRVKDPVEMQTVLDLLSKETARLSGMIESVLDWSRIESGKKQYRRERLPTTDLVDAAVNAFKAQRIDAPFDLQLTLAPNLGEIEVDRDALSGALLNLLQNAWKYSREGDKRIELRGIVDDDFVVLEVEDHGVGIPRREQKRIFDRFYRVDSLLTRDTEGSGLGLSIAQRIVQAHDGWISVDSVPGRGSTFRIHLPLVQ